MSNSEWPQRWQPTRLPRLWDSPGKNTGVGCHFLLQCMKVKSESEVTQLCPTPSDPMDCSLPGSSVHGIFQARVLEWGAIAFSGLYSTAFNCKFQYTYWLPGASRWLSAKEYSCQCRRHRFDPWVGKIPWKRKWQPTALFFSGKSHGQRSLARYSQWGYKKRLNNWLPSHMQTWEK